jgi:hypothetical protein
LALHYGAGVSSAAGRSARGPGIALVVVGFGLVAASVAGLQWYQVDGGRDVASGGGFTFSELGRNADQLNAPVAAAYFAWLAFALAAAVAVLGVLANLPGSGRAPVRVLGFLVGAAGTVSTYYALAQLFYAQHAAGGSEHSVFLNASYGVWCALAGFLVAALGAALGPRRA